jgi:hypothetical protein
MNRPRNPKRTIRVPAPKPRLPIAPPSRPIPDRREVEERKKWRTPPREDPEEDRALNDA